MTTLRSIIDLRRRWPPWPLWVGSAALWTFLTATIVSSNLESAARTGRGVSIAAVTIYVLLGTVPWALSMPLLVWFSAKRLIVGSRRWRHLTQILVLTLIWLAATTIVVHAFRAAVAGRSFGEQIAQWLVSSGWGTAVIEYWTLVLYAVFGQAIGFWDRTRQRERELARAATERAELAGALTQAQLANLRMRVHPHFIFNSLNSVAALIRRGDDARAVEMVVGLADLMRAVLSDGGLPAHTLGQEVALLTRYLDVQRMRYGDRVRLSIVIPDALQSSSIPTLLLQPLVENAVRHGIAELPGAAEIRISAEGTPERLVVTVANDGPPLPPGFDPERVTGIGLALVRRRLGLWGDRTGTLVLRNTATGVEAAVSLPLSSDGEQP